MNKIRKVEILNYLHNIHIEYSKVKTYDMLEDIKEHITKEKKFNNGYVKKYVIDNIDRNIENSRLSNYLLNKNDFNSIIEYIEIVITNDKHIFHNFIKECIEENIILGGFSDNIDKLLFISALFYSVMNFINILKLYLDDEKKLLTKKRDKHKIKNAIDLLLDYVVDENTRFYLKSINIYEKEISKETLLSCFFCSFSKIIKEEFYNLSNKKIEELSKEILHYIFNSNKDYRIYNNIENIEYKNYKLRRYTTK